MKAKQSFWQKPLGRQVTETCGWACLGGAVYVFSEWYAVSPIGYGGLLLLSISVFLMVPWLLAWVAVPLSMVFILWRRTRKHALSVLLCSLICLPLGLLAIRVSIPIRPVAFHQLAERSRSLVQAIHRYTEDTGQPPADLNALVPDYLAAVPQTGMPAYPDYEYSIGYDPDRWDGNPWLLYLNTPSGGINFDKFLYFPLQNYPEKGYGGVLRRMGDWAYVYE